MSIIRFGMERADGGESQIYAYFNAGGKGSIHIGRKPENHYPQGPREWTGDIIIPPEDFSELVARLLECGGFEDVTGVRDALDEVYESVRDYEQNLREQQTDPRSAVLSDEGRDTIARLWLNGTITADEAEELVGEDVFEEIRQARDAVEEDIEWGLETATAGHEDWEKTTPTDAGESLFGGDDSDVNECVEDEWIDETTPEERVRSVIEHTYVPESVGYISDRARTSEETAHKHLLHLAEDGFVEETDDPECGPMYRRSPESLVLEQARDIRDRVDADTLIAHVSEMQERIREYREETGADTPEDAALKDQLFDGETLRDWQTTQRNLAFARVALALSVAEETVEPPETFRHHLASLNQLDRMFRHFDNEEQNTDDLE